VSLDPVRAEKAIAAIVRRSGRKGLPLTRNQVLDRLAKVYQMTHAVEVIRQNS
jgi:hypothetical protein